MLQYGGRRSVLAWSRPGLLLPGLIATVAQGAPYGSQREGSDCQLGIETSEVSC